jgi:hypothetical protein
MQRRPLTYLDILASTDAQAREEYTYEHQDDPRVNFFRQFHEEDEEEVEANEAERGADVEEHQEIYTDASSTLLNAPRPVQAPPTKYKRSKRIILLDTAQRDWTYQPNAYSNTFVFGSGRSISLQNAAVYTNSKFIPITAAENPGQIVGLPNTTGWTFSGIFYPPYNPMVPRGTFLFNETRSNVVTGTLGFGTDLYLSNVAAVRLIRAALPLRRFDSFANDVFTQSNINPGIPTNQDYITSFHTQPYIFLHVNNFYNQYYGANNACTTAFAALVQHQRQFISPGNVITVQHQDFYPWSAEAHEFSPPMLSLSNFNWYLQDQAGNTFNQLDTWEVRNIQYTVSGILLGGLLTGAAVTNQLSFFINRTDITDVSSFTYFSPAEFRVGDIVTFYPADVQAILNDPCMNPILSNFFNTFLNGAGYLVNYVETIVNDTLEFGTLFGAVYYSYNYDTQRSNIANVAALTGLDPAGPLSNINILINSNAYVNPDAQNFGLSQYYPLRIMNKSLQASLAFEVVTLDPDNSHIPFMVPA